MILEVGSFIQHVLLSATSAVKISQVSRYMVYNERNTIQHAEIHKVISTLKWKISNMCVSSISIQC